MLKQTKMRIMQLFCAVALIVVWVTPVIAEEFAITDFSPKKGSVGDNIVIYGKGFAFHNISSNKVKFGEKSADVVFADAARIVTTVPNGAISAPISVSRSNIPTVQSSNAFNVVSSSAQIVSSGTALGKGDRVILDTYLTGIKCPEFSGKEYYAPPDAILWVSDVDDAKMAHIRFKENWTDDRIGSGKESTILNNKYTGGMVKAGIEYTIEAEKLQHAPLSIQGWDYGVLVVPFKYHPQDRALTGEATLGGYAGYRYSWPGVSLTFPVLSAGVGVVNVLKDSTTTETKSAPSFSIAGGAIISLTKNGLFQIGILFGADWAGKGNHYRYEGQPWIAVSFGTNITK